LDQGSNLARHQIRFHPAAIAELGAAVEWYSARSRRAAERFLEELDQLMSRISDSPVQFTALESGVRKANFRRFPYMIMFREHAKGVDIIAIAHGHRRPGYWQARV
jgi:plasmid stabilization system protein ParE